MKYALTSLLITGFILLGSFMPLSYREPVTPAIPSPLASYSPMWNDAKYLKCNTATKARYLTPAEKEVIYVLNLVRMDPALFANTVLPKYPVTHSPYYESLLVKLRTIKPLGALASDSLCFVGAKCHAVNSGIEGYVGHERGTQECRDKWYFNGECCDYGHDKALDIVLSLLIDDGVPSLGHRNICLSKYVKLGVSIQPHKLYRYNAVLDFHY